MNGVDFLARTFGSGIDKIANVIGKWGSTPPADDSKSGIKIGDKTYQVVVSLNGCYWYIDEDGKKQNVASIPATTKWEWVNIAEKVLKDFRTCYRTPGGKVEVWSWYLLNDQMEVLKEQHRITDSTDMDNPVGTFIEGVIPNTWIMIDCDLPDMTERDVTFISRCYKTPDGKVEIEGFEAIDDKLVIRESMYSIIQSTDPNFPANFDFNVIPANWTRMVCDFPDMTERDVTVIKECYKTAGGKVELEGLRAIDNVLGTREAVYTVVKSTDPDIEVGTILEDNIPEDWERMVCDFPDMEDREIIEVNECYLTGTGKVNVIGYQSTDLILGLREERYFVAKTTDPENPAWSLVYKIPNNWVRTECDFPNMADRHVLSVNECYTTPGGKVHIGGYRVVDSIIGLRGEYLYVMETTDPDISRGTSMTSVPSDWNKVICDFPDATTADTEIVDNCFGTENGKVQLRTYMTIDGNGNVRNSSHIIMKSTDPAYRMGDQMTEIPAVWLNRDCDFASATERHVVTTKECYNTSGGAVYIEGINIVDNFLNTEKSKFTVVESTDASIIEGTTYDAIPAGFVKTVCKCNCSN